MPTTLLAQTNSDSGSLAAKGKRKYRGKAKSKAEQKKKGALLQLQEAWALSCGISR